MTWDTRSSREEGYVFRVRAGEYLHFAMDNLGKQPRGLSVVPLAEATIFPGHKPWVLLHWRGVERPVAEHAVRSTNTITTTLGEGATERGT